VSAVALFRVGNLVEGVDKIINHKEKAMETVFQCHGFHHKFHINSSEPESLLEV
jgi:hypothetical protein